MLGYETALGDAINILNNTQDLNTAKNAFLKVAQDFPQKFESYYYLGIIESELNNFKSAIYYMQKALDIVPFYQGYRKISEFHIFNQDRKCAIENIKMALIYNPFDEELKNILYRLAPKSNFIDKTDISIDGFYSSSKECKYLKYTKIYDEKQIKRTPTVVIKDQLTKSQENLFNSTIEQYKQCQTKEGFVLEIPNAMVFAKQSEQTYFITQDNKILSDMLDECGPKLSANVLPDVINLCDNLLVLSSCWGGNFYHWLTWTIPRLQMIYNAGYKLDDFDKILINYVGFDFQKDLLKLLNIPKSKIIGTLENGAVLKAKKIVSASLPEFSCTPEIVTKSMRNLLLKPEYINEDYPKRIYLSRNKSRSRFVVNEDELQEFIKKYDFTTIYAEDLTFEEQVKYFCNADIILSQHGAGLTNIAFCKQNTKIIEIYNENIKDSLDTAFWKISSDLGLKHYLMFGEAIGSGNIANMKVEISKLEEIFSKINI